MGFAYEREFADFSILCNLLKHFMLAKLFLLYHAKINIEYLTLTTSVIAFKKLIAQIVYNVNKRK